MINDLLWYFPRSQFFLNNNRLFWMRDVDMKREFDKTERRRRNQIKRSNKAILEKRFSHLFCQVFSHFVFYFFFQSFCLVFAKNSVMKQNRLGPLICWMDRAYIEDWLRFYLLYHSSNWWLFWKHYFERVLAKLTTRNYWQKMSKPRVFSLFGVKSW